MGDAAVKIARATCSYEGAGTTIEFLYEDGASSTSSR